MHCKLTFSLLNALSKIHRFQNNTNDLRYLDDNLVTKLQAEVIYNSLKPGVQIEVQYQNDL